METLLVITYIVLFIFLIQKLLFFEVEGISRNGLTIIFIIKVVFGFLVGAIYTYYYSYRPTADVFKYFDASKIMFDTLKTNPTHFFKMLFGIDNHGPDFNVYYNNMNHWNREVNSSIYNDNHLIIRINTVMRIFSFGYFDIHTVFFSFLSSLGLTAIYKTFIPVLKNKKNELICVVFMLPSVLFWGSGVLKESLVMFFLGFLIFHFNKLTSLKSILICLVTSVALGILKFYVIAALVPSLLFMFWLNKTGPSKIFLKFTLVLVITGVLGLNVDKFTAVQNPLQMLTQKQNDFNKLALGLQIDASNKPIPPAGSAIHLNKMEPTIVSFLKNSPQAIVNTLFRPFIWNTKSPMVIFAGIENIFVFSFIILCIMFALPYKHIPWQYVLFCVSFAVIQLLFIGTTTPIVGAIVRYKIIAIPFLLIAFLLILDKEKITNKLKLHYKLFG